MDTINKLYKIGVMVCYPLGADDMALATTRLSNKIKNNLNKYAWNKKSTTTPDCLAGISRLVISAMQVKNPFQTKPIINLF